MKPKGKKRDSAAKLSKRNENSGEAAGSSKTDTPSTVDKLLDRAEVLLSQLQFDAAEKFCQRAIETAPTDERPYITYGLVCVETGKLDKAKEMFLEAVKLVPDGGDQTKFLHLGQLHEGKPAVVWYEKSLEVLKNNMQMQKESLPGASKFEEVTPADLSSVYCAMAEIYMTDLCDDSDAESRCESYLKSALELSPDNAEAWQSYGNFLISAQRMPEARDACKNSVKLWLPQLQEAMNDQTGAAVEVECPLNFDARKSCAKLLMEVEEFETAGDVLDTLLAEDDEDVEVWYFYGWNNFLQGQDFYAAAKAYLSHAQEVAKKLHYADAEVLGHVSELLTQLADVPMESEEAEDDNNGDLENLEEDEEENDQPMGHP